MGTKVAALICGRGESTQSWSQAQGMTEERGKCPEQIQGKMVAQRDGTPPGEDGPQRRSHHHMWAEDRTGVGAGWPNLGAP